MDYIQLNCEIEAGDITLVQEMLTHELAGLEYESFSETEQGLVAYIQAPLFDENKLREVTFCSDLHLGKIRYTWELIKDKNWNEEWENNFHPVHIANRCYIRAPFHPAIPNMEYEIVMVPKMAFGTGHHETTSLMVEMMLDMDFKNRTVLDMGCGTGVLAIMASMLGAKDILAIDIDEWAYHSTVENAQLNHILNITPLLGDIPLIAGKQFDVIVANINRNILLAHIEQYSKSLSTGGYLFMSGIYTEDLPMLEAEASKYKLTKLHSLEKNRWAAVKFCK